MRDLLKWGDYRVWVYSCLLYTSLNQLLTLSPDKIVYISCDVATQARDIDILQQHDYHVKKCQPVDMFPQSFHIENIVLLTK